MSNERLRDALMRRGLSTTVLAEQLHVDPKTVERWIARDRLPYPRYRSAVAAQVGESESWLWPGAISAQREETASRSELVEMFPRRALIPFDFWLRMFGRATAFVDVLIYAGLFLPEQLPTALDLLKQKGSEGVRVRLLLGDPNSDAVRLRGVEERIGAEAVPVKVRNALDLLRGALSDVPGVATRLHDSTLYTSIYRADDTMIANTHVLGLPAAQAPALHLRRLSAGGVFDTYVAMFDRVWDGAAPA